MGKRAAYLCDSKAIKADWSEGSGSLFENVMMPKKGWKVIGCYIIQLSPEGEVNSGGYIPRREASRYISCLLYSSPSPRDLSTSRMPSSA